MSLTAVIAARASASTTAPPAGAAGREIRCHPPRKTIRAPVDLSNSSMPSQGAQKVHWVPSQLASSPSCRAQAPLAGAATSQHSPGAGEPGGSVASPSTAGWSRASIRANASLTKNSFCACPAGVAVLRAAQGFGLGGGIQAGLRSVWPAQPAQRRFEGRRGFDRATGQDAALAFNHDGARFAEARGHQRNPRVRQSLGDEAHPFGTGAGLAEAASRHDQPDVPVIVERQLAVMRIIAEVGDEGIAFLLRQPTDEGLALERCKARPHTGARQFAAHSGEISRPATFLRSSSTFRSIASRTCAALTLARWARSLATVSLCAESRRRATATSSFRSGAGSRR